MNGKAMIYPNLPDQVSFSTHHREPGEHTDVVSQIPYLDDLTLDKDPLFTVPLVTNSSALESYLTELPLKALPVVNFYHEKVKNIYSLRQVGLYLLETFNSNYKNFVKEPLPSCILDYIAPNETYQKRKWDLLITFEPTGSIFEQIEQLNAAFEIGRILHRKLVLPKLKLPSGRQVPFEQIIKFNSVFVKSPVDATGRSVVVQKINGTGIIQSFTADQNFFPLGGLTDKEVFKWFGGCQHDHLLKIDRPDFLFSQHSNLQQPINDKLFAAEYQNWIKEVAKEFGNGIWKGNYICIDMNRPTKEICDKLSRKAGGQPFFQANCITSPLIEVSKLPNFNSGKRANKPSIYAIINDEDWDTVAVTLTGENKEGKISLPLVRKAFIMEKIKFKYDLPDSAELFKLIEAELCMEAKEFIGSLYSGTSVEILKRRSRLGKKSRIIGR